MVNKQVYGYETYTEMRQQVVILFNEGKLAEAAELLAWGLDRFPENLYANTYNLATCWAFLEQPGEAIKALTYGLDHGVWYGIWDFGAGFWAPVKASEGFAIIEERSRAAQAELQKTAKPELIVELPEGYTPEKQYPLFIALHGGGETAADFKLQWVSSELKNKFIVAYPQSSRVISMHGFSWMGDAQDREEVLAAYQTVLKDFSVNSDEVIMGGFSSGGHLTLSMLLDESPLVSVSGFVILCPPVPEAYPPEAVARIQSRGQRGVLLTTEMDTRKDAQQALAEAFQSANIPLQFIVTPNIGHWYPEDLAEQIDRGIEFIQNK